MVLKRDPYVDRPELELLDLRRGQRRPEPVLPGREKVIFAQADADGDVAEQHGSPRNNDDGTGADGAYARRTSAE